MKILFLILCLFIAFVSVDFGQNAPKGQKTKKSKAARKASNDVILEPVNVTNLSVGHTQISAKCQLEDSSCSADVLVKVSATYAAFSEVPVIYTISGGKIIGSGVNVVWDLSGVQPGEYTITAGARTEPWGVIGQTQTRRVRILDCADCTVETKIVDN